MLRFVLIAMFVGACGSVDTYIEDQITIEQGVYGLLISGCEMDGCQDQPAAHELVVVYSASANGPFAQVKSSTAGVYQMNLLGGDYTLCTTYSCTEITVPANDKIRVDWTSGPGGGIWSSDK
jgi:hypothetical protein